jgi:hypothetical protein
MNTKLMGLAVTGLALASTGCKLTDKLKDALDGENDSYCEAACDWAVACAADGSALSEDELMEACIAETEAQDPDCGGAEDALSIDQAVILNECTADQIAQDCAALTGEEDEIVKGTPPVATCMIAYGQGTDALVSAVSDLPGSVTELNDIQAYKTYNVARNAVLADGAEICERFEETMCGYMTECLVEKGGIDVGADIEQATTDACIESVFGNITDSCISEGRYDSVIPVDYNPARWGAEECMDDWDETAASSSACDIFTSVPSAKCALAFTSTDQVETVFNGIISFAGDYGDFF